MKRTLCGIAFCVLFAGFGSDVGAADPPADAIMNAVLEHHIAPPTRKEMLVGGCNGVCRSLLDRWVVRVLLGQILKLEAEEPTIAQSARRNRNLLPPERKTIEEAFLDGLLASVPGEAQLLSAKQRRVAEQMDGNRYVGLHITLGVDAASERPQIGGVFPGGPADRAGIHSGDVIERIDSVDTHRMRVMECVDRLRGEDGTPITITVRRPASGPSRTLTIKRGQLPRVTVSCDSDVLKHSPKARLGLERGIAHVKVDEIMASTTHEVRKLYAKIESEGKRAIVLDLRGTRSNSMHATVLLADALLEHGTIGRVRTVHGETRYEADTDAVFPGWPMAVLVDIATSGPAEWLAAALQDNQRAVIVGSPTGSRVNSRPLNGVRTRVPVGDGSWFIELVTGEFLRGDGTAVHGKPELRGDDLGVSGRNRTDRAVSSPLVGGVKPDIETSSSSARTRPAQAQDIYATNKRPKAISRDPAPASNESRNGPLDTAIEHLLKSLKPEEI